MKDGVREDMGDVSDIEEILVNLTRNYYFYLPPLLLEWKTCSRNAS